MSYQPPQQSQDYASRQAPPFAAFPGTHPHQQTYPYSSPQMMPEAAHSKVGIASFVMGLLVGLGELVLVVIAGVMETSTPGGMDDKDPKVAILGLLLLGGLFLALVGAILGVVGLFEKNRKRLFAVLGLIFNGLILGLVVLLLIVGLAMQ
jgi:hypothetical protein